MITCRVCGHLNRPERLTCEDCGSDLSDSVDWIGDIENENVNNEDYFDEYDDYGDHSEYDCYYDD